MEKVKKFLTLFAATLLLLPIMEAQHYPPPRPLCASQFALASYACSLLPFSPMTPPPAPSPPDDDNGDDDDEDNGDEDDDGGDDGGDEGGDDGGDDGGSDGGDDDGNDGGGGDGGNDGGDQLTGHGHHGHGHNRRRSHGHRRNRHGHGHGHRRGHGHHHRHHHKPPPPLSPQEDGCCKWLHQLDNQCVCDLLMRLPPFLLKPAHTYSVFVGSTCNVTYTCAHP